MTKLTTTKLQQYLDALADCECDQETRVMVCLLRVGHRLDNLVLTRVPKRWNFLAAHCCRRIHQCSSESNLSYFRRTPFGSLDRLHVAFTADSNIVNSQWNSLSLMSRTITLLIVGRGLSCNPWESFPMQLEHIEPFLFKSKGLIRRILWQQRKLSRTILKDIYSNQIAFPELSHHTYTSNPCKNS